ncbi:MAG: ester cyclase [Chloroflexi bacterium]|nr:ester cyclase [Chloroflexota bacterium]
MVAEGDKVVVRFTVTGTHQGFFAGIPATGKQVAMQGIIIHRLHNGKIIEDWVVRDTLGLMQQLGMIPVPG